LLATELAAKRLEMLKDASTERALHFFWGAVSINFEKSAIITG